MSRQRVRSILLTASGLLVPLTFYYLSPYLVLQAASEGIASGSLVLFGAQFLFALVFGRAFCGWVCPAGAIAEGTSRLRDRPFRRRLLDGVKYAVWLPWVGFIVLLSVKAGGLRRIEIGYQTWHGISVSSVYSLAVLAGVLALVVGLTLWAGRRGFCHTFCWMAPFMIVGQALRDRLRLPGLRLRARSEACVACGACRRACAMSLDVQGMVKRGHMSNRECILCARCVDVCPKHVLSLSWRRSGRRGSGGG
jgi:ferredoxin-type protein NapH